MSRDTVVLCRPYFFLISVWNKISIKSLPVFGNTIAPFIVAARRPPHSEIVYPEISRNFVHEIMIKNQFAHLF